MSTPAERRVWDPIVRIAHGTFASGCAVAFLTEEQRALHQTVGYLVLAALTVRILWGFFGRGHARFASFVRGPREVLAYLAAMLRGEEPYYEGHNPLGAVMIVGLLVLLAVITISGWMTTLDMFWGVGWVEDLHETSSWLLLWIVPLHVGGVLFASLRHRENLVRAMITGTKPPRAESAAPRGIPAASKGAG
jgi:cytochrome b